MNAKVLSATLVAALAISSAASAETKSWGALKTHFNASSAIALSVDVAAIKKGTKSLTSIVQQFLDEEKDVATGLALLKATCSIDPLDVVTDVSVALDKDANGLIAVGLSGIDEAKLLACANKMVAMQDPKAKITSKPGKLSEYSVMGETLYAMWPSKDVVVFSTKPEKKDLYEAPGSAPSGDLATYLGKTNQTGVFFIAANINDKDVKAGYGAIALGKGTFAGTGKLIAPDAKMGAKMLKEAQTELARGIEKANKKSLSNAAKFLKGIKLAGAGAEISIDGSVSDADVVGLLPALDKVF